MEARLKSAVERWCTSWKRSGRGANNGAEDSSDAGTRIHPVSAQWQHILKPTSQVRQVRRGSSQPGKCSRIKGLRSVRRSGGLEAFKLEAMVDGTLQ